MPNWQAIFATNERRKLLRNSGWLLTDKLMRTAVGVVVSVTIARHLGPTEFGILSFSTTLTGIFAMLAGLGLEDVLVCDLVRATPERRTAWRAAWQVRWGAAVAAFAGSVIVAWAWRPEAPRVWAVVAIVACGLLFAPVNLVDVWFLANGRMRRPTVARQVALWTAAGWRLLLVAGGASLGAFAAACVVEAALVAVALMWIFKTENLGKWEEPPEGALAAERRRLVRAGWPLMASGALVLMTMQADRLLLARWWGDAAVGIYAAAARLTEVFHALPVALGAALMPRLTTLRREDEARYWQLARKTLAGMALAGAGCAAVMTWCAPRLLPALFGASYTGAARILCVHVWTLAFIFVASLRSRLLVIEAGTRWVLGMSLLTALLNIGGNLLLIPRFGGMGAAWVAVGAWSFGAFGAPWCFAATRELIRKMAASAPPVSGAGK